MSISPYRWICRCQIELTSPMKIGVGAADDWDDAMIVRDHDGLPYIPGTSLAGALRAAYLSEYGHRETKLLFGYIESAESQASRLHIGQGVLVNSAGRARDPLCLASITDSLFMSARSEYKRNHARLSDLGVVDTAGLHDASHLPSGFRFLFELRLIGESAEACEKESAEIMGLLNSYAVTLGGGRGTGLGQFKMISAQGQLFDLMSEECFALYSSYSSSLNSAAPQLERDELSRLRSPKLSVVTWELNAEIAGAWLVAGGDATDQDMRSASQHDKPKIADMIPWRESRATWRDSETLKGSYDESEASAMIPGSSLRGTIRHRAAFHLNRLQGVFSDQQTSGSPDETMSQAERRAQIAMYGGLNNRALWSLFGGLEAGSHLEGCAGRLVVEDVWPMGAQHGFQDHVTIDRLTGGALKGHLFDESIMWGGKVTLKIHVYDSQGQVPSIVRRAFACALRDLERGHLAFGGGTGRGHGHLRPGSIGVWSDDNGWINGHEAEERREVQ